ncbi:receptor-type tyrosine-protein phosphatase beta-like isoform X1 [Rana temporaria]|uniref:receptor-type tyrosine-protein phosphatase beta-like isoform X1 n=1 Tax=Rana temporaria TaxID=8407 RepID=UPI001AAD11F7|nr:receptor-type tyrosine-protein phosphatase beta-like isoform X1 [Rana temporaria]
MTFVSGTQYTMHYGNDTYDCCCYNFTTKPYPVNLPQFSNGTSSSLSLNWSSPNESQSSYTYRVQTNVTLPSTMINNIIVTNQSATIVDLTPGETYTFLIYTRAADNSTESDPVSLTTCTVPGQAGGVTVNNYQSVNSLVVNWTAPTTGIASNYNVTITGDVNRTLQNTSTQVTFTDLLPGRNYTVTVQTISGSCNSPITTVTTEATYPTPPGNITFTTIGTNTTTLSWVEPVNMTEVTKSYNITYYWNALSSITVPSSSTNVALTSLKSGSNYTITVVTIGVRGYQSTPVSRYVFTKPYSVNLPQVITVTSTSVSLNWSAPNESQGSYTYRVQTNVTSSSSLINNTIVSSQSATIVNLIPGETYTFLIYTRAADNSTESDPVSLTTCTVPGQAGGVTVNNYQSVNSLVVNWIAPPTGIASIYNVTITGDVNRTLQNTSTQVTFTDLLPGRNYTVTVQTISGSCNSPITTATTEATYPTPPGSIQFIAIGTNTTTFNWGEPENMTVLTKLYNINYHWNASSSNTVPSNSPSVTLQSLKSGSNYTITVVTVGVRGYQSKPVSRYVFTKPYSVNQPQYFNVTSTSVSLYWSVPNESQSSYTYRVQTNVTSSSSLINNVIVTNQSATIVNLTPGQTYTFLIYTRAADNSTESDPVSLTTCTVPGQAGGVTVNNYQSVNSLAVNWIAPTTGIASNYNVTITGDVNRTLQNTSTQVTFTDLLPGRNYTVTVQTISGSCNSPITTATTEATYPTPPGSINFIAIGTNTTTFNWGEPENMTVLTKLYNINYYWNASSSNTVPSNSPNVTLQSLKSGSNYTITVVTVGARGYQSKPVSRYVFTKPYSVNQPQYFNVTSTSVFLNWSAPNESQSSYTYRVQTNVTSSSSLINNVIVINQSATIVNLTPGQTYTFLIYTRAADNSTESDPVSLTTCTVPGQAGGVTVNNYQSVNSLVVSWTAPPTGIASIYNVTITGDVNRTLQNTSTQVTFTDLLPGRNYTVTVQTISGSCNSPITTATTEATYPTPPGSIHFIAIGTNTTTFNWGEPENMTVLTKSYNINYYWNASSSNTVPSYSPNVTLQSLKSGSNYTITVVTVGARGYQSKPVSRYVFTKPYSVNQPQYFNVTSTSESLNWIRPDESQSSYTYRVQTNVTSSSSLINNTIVINQSATIVNLTPGETYTFLIYTRAADNSTESDPVSLTTCTVPGQAVGVTVNNYRSVNSLEVSWTAPIGIVSNYNVTITGDVNRTLQNNSTQVTFNDLLPGRNYTVTVQTISGSCNSPITTATEATYPTPPGNITFNTIAANNITLSWVQPVNMTNLVMSYNITYGNASSSPIIGAQKSNTNSTTLQSLTSGTNYTISVMTVGDRGYQSTPVTGSVYTKPWPVSNPNFVNVTSDTVILNWSKPPEYQNTYRYRVLTIVTSSSTLISNTTMYNESTTLNNLTSGETYTFSVYVRAADNVTESDPVNKTICTGPGQVSSITLNNYNSTNTLGVTWTAATGRVDSYIISITGVVSNTTQTNSTQTNFTGLLPGSLYTVTVQTNSGNCSQTSSPVMEATYPTPPGSINFTMVGTKNVTLSWGDPVNMTEVVKSYNITYWNSSSPSIIAGPVTSNTTSVTLPNLISGTNYIISVVTVGALGYKSTAVFGSVCTKPLSVKSLQIGAKTTNSMSLTWTQPDEYQTNYTYRVQTNATSSSTLNTSVPNASATIGNLTAGETYTFLIYTISTCNSTESDPTSIIDCTLPGQVVGATANSYTSVNSLFVNWTAPQGKVSYYNVTITEYINNTIQTLTIQPNLTQVNVTGLLPGRVYNVTIVTVSSSCSQAAPSLSQATYPTPPGIITFPIIGTKNVTLSWGDPVDMTGVVKSYNIYWNTSSPSIIAGTVTSNTTSVTLQNLTSGTNYTISVVTVGVWGYQSTAVIESVCTKPISVTSLQIVAKTTNSTSLIWTQPDEYQSSYTYRVQTKATSSSEMINNTIVSGASATIGNLTAGETYTFTVYTISACNKESDPTSITDCTFPGQVVSAAANSYTSVNSLFVNWTAPQGKVSNYNVTITEYINNTIQTLTIQPNLTQVNVTGLSPGRVYNVTIVTVSSSCSQAAPSLSQATYPTPPGSITFPMRGTKNVTLSWGDPVNMAGVVKSYNIIYRNSSSPSIIAGNVTSDTTSVTLQNLTSGTNYTISVVTVGVWGYQSTPVIGSDCTKPMPVQSLQNTSATTTSISLNWSRPDGYQSSYTYKVQTSPSSIVNDIIVTNESATIVNLTPGGTYTFTVYVRAANDVTESDPMSVTTCTVPEPVSELNVSGFTSESILLQWKCPIGNFTSFSITYGTQRKTISSNCITNGKQEYNITGLSAYTPYTITVSTLSCGKDSTAVTIQNGTASAPPPLPTGSSVIELKASSYNQISYTFRLFNETNGPVGPYAVIVTTDNAVDKFPSKDVLTKTYSDFTSKRSSSYVSLITNVTSKARWARDTAANNGQQTVLIGDGSAKNSYYNSPLQAVTTYCVTVAGFTRIEYKPDGTINTDTSLVTFFPYSYQVSTPQNPGVIAGAVIGTILGILVIAALVGYFVWYRRRNEGKPKANGMSFSNVQSVVRKSLAMNTSNFPKHFEKQSADCNLGFSAEYEKLCTVGKRLPKTIGDQPENREKNRYTNVLPYDISRVTLSTNENSSDDYINANFIPGFIMKKEFIAAQGPLPRTLNDFWRMVWEKDVRAIAMLTRCVELGKVKCEEYWPSWSARKFGNLSVAATNETVLPDWTIRDFIVTNPQTKQTKQVRHFHFTAWPDHGVPKATEDLVQFRNLIREYTSGHSSPSSPILVHCSAGVGRTGTLIALDRIIKQIEADDKVDVYGVVYDLRMHRDLMVQTESQYVFLNQCAVDFINSRKTKDHDIYQNTESIYQNTESIYQNAESIYQNTESVYQNATSLSNTDL